MQAGTLAEAKTSYSPTGRFNRWEKWLSDRGAGILYGRSNTAEMAESGERRVLRWRACRRNGDLVSPERRGQNPLILNRQYKQSRIVESLLEIPSVPLRGSRGPFSGKTRKLNDSDAVPPRHHVKRKMFAWSSAVTPRILSPAS